MTPDREPEPRPEQASPPGHVPGPTAFTPDHRTGLDVRRSDRDRTLDAIHQLEHALGSAAAGREVAWHEEVAGALDVLDLATAEEQRNADLPESLLSDIARTQRRLRNRVRGLRLQYRQICDAITSIRGELAADQGEIDVADLRQRLAWLLTALRHQRARESDLVYEAYYEAFQRDIEEDPGASP
jgi:hypothetical protein